MATILIVDDHPANRDLLVTLLEYQKHRIFEASNGVEALEKTRELHPDLVITDVLMPEMDGYEFVRNLRKDAGLASTTVIFYTSTYLEPEARQLAEACGVKHILIKPVEPELVFTTINAALHETGRPAEPPPEDSFGEQHIQLMTNKLVEKVDQLESANAQLITEMEQRQRAEQSLRDSEEHYRLLFESNPLPMYVYDAETLQMLAGNSAATHHYGYTTAEFLQLTAEALYPLEERQRMGENLSILRQPPESSGVWIHARHDGTRIAVEIITHTITFQYRSAHLVLANDVTARLRAEAETRQRMVELEAINRISSTLRVSHTLEEMFPALLNEALAIVDGQAGSLWLRPDENSEVRRMSASGWTGQSETDPRPGPLVNAVLAADQPLRWTPTQPISGSPEGSSGIGLPIQIDNHNIGVLLILNRRNQAISDSNLNLLNTLVEIAGTAIQRTLLHEKTEQRLQRIASLHTIDLAISSNNALVDTLGLLLDQVRQQLEVDAARILIFDRLSQRYETASARGFSNPVFENTVRTALPEDINGLFFDPRASQMIDLDAPQNFHQAELPYLSLARAERYHTYARAPLYSKGSIDGYLEIFLYRRMSPEPEWLSFLETLAGQAQIAVESATLLHNLQRSNRELTLAYDATIEGWSRALDLRDRETEGHTQRVTQLVMRLAQSMNIPEEDLAHIRRGALLHDIGKLGIPDNILLKPGPLNEDEWKIMRQHPVYAYEMLSPIPYLRPALDIPYCHHEKWDGSGYPRGLRGEQIPLAARLFTVIDVWDALSSDRPYRPGWPAERVRRYLQDHSGELFDPLAVHTFFSISDHPAAIQNP